MKEQLVLLDNIHSEKQQEAQAEPQLFSGKAVSTWKSLVPRDHGKKSLEISEQKFKPEYVLIKLFRMRKKQWSFLEQTRFHLAVMKVMWNRTKITEVTLGSYRVNELMC